MNQPKNMPRRSSRDLADPKEQHDEQQPPHPENIGTKEEAFRPLPSPSGELDDAEIASRLKAFIDQLFDSKAMHGPEGGWKAEAMRLREQLNEKVGELNAKSRSLSEKEKEYALGMEDMKRREQEVSGELEAEKVKGKEKESKIAGLEEALKKEKDIRTSQVKEWKKEKEELERKLGEAYRRHILVSEERDAWRHNCLFHTAHHLKINENLRASVVQQEELEFQKERDLFLQAAQRPINEKETGETPAKRRRTMGSGQPDDQAQGPSSSLVDFQQFLPLVPLTNLLMGLQMPNTQNIWPQFMPIVSGGLPIDLEQQNEQGPGPSNR